MNRLPFPCVPSQSACVSALLLLLGLVSTPARVHGAEPAIWGYAVVASTDTMSDPDWKRVVDALQRRHQAELFVYKNEVTSVSKWLRGLHPRHVCFVARPEEASREFVGKVHVMLRQLDDDPYADAFWGIVTGYDASNALRLATHEEPLVVRKVASGTEVALEMCESGQWYCELKKNRWVTKEKGGTAEERKGPDDTTAALAGLLNGAAADLFVTSGHATERDWMIGYSYRNGFFKCENGNLYGEDMLKERHPIYSPNPKVYLPVGNCLMGHINDRDAMALAFLNSGGVNQMAGYTVLTWYGYMGWGMLDYFVEQPGRFTLNQAYQANHHALMHRLTTHFPELANAEVAPGQRWRGPVQVGDAAKREGLRAMDGVGLLHDRDVVAFYGDPAWVAIMAEGPRRWEQVLTEKDGLYTLDIKPSSGAQSFEPVNINGSQRGGRPIVAFLPHRIGPAEVVEGADLQPVITDDLVLVPLPTWDEGRTYHVTFRATRL